MQHAPAFFDMYRTLLIGRHAGRAPSESDDLSDFPPSSPSSAPCELRVSRQIYQPPAGDRAPPQPPSTLASTPGTIQFTCYRGRRAYHYSLLAPRGRPRAPIWPYKPSLHPLQFSSPLPPSLLPRRRLPVQLERTTSRQSRAAENLPREGEQQRQHQTCRRGGTWPTRPRRRPPPTPPASPASAPRLPPWPNRRSKPSHFPSSASLAPLLRVGSDRALEERIGA